MKKLIARIVASLLVLVVFFFAGAFISMETNTKKWDEFGRIIYTIMAFWAIGVVNIFFDDLIKS